MNLAGLETLTPRISAIIRQLTDGGTNALAEATLSAATETRIEARLCVVGALVVPVALDAGAAAAGIFLKDTGRGFFVLGHAPGGEGRRVRFEVRRP
ncbi:hypothetical protein [Methylorubrum populi]|uniref:Uncharacterized protein n=1 Tax=Methylorubrum populi TaxID=223967 RepID=A0A833J015_9HYPH|nr:hypothetical protein [Methylorubrum populi]KAB7782165.1 hypothetical protein F8B43_4920 [Methylorubrum populi]